MNVTSFSVSLCHWLVGLLTVEAKNRLTLKDLSRHPWLKPDDAPSTPLQTRSILGQSKTKTASALKHTFQAFHIATKGGFTLGDVSRAPLAKRRQNKRGLSPRDGSSPEKSSGEGEGQVSVSSRGSEESCAGNTSELTPVANSNSRRPSKLNLNLPF